MGLVGWAVIIGGGLIMLYSLSNKKWFSFLLGLGVAIFGAFLSGFVQT